MKQKGNRKKRSAARRATVKTSGAHNMELTDELARFAEYHQAGRLSRNLRKMLMEFLTYEGAAEARYLQDLFYDLQGLFEFLEILQQHQEQRRV